jgi:hypothetical protein
MIITNFKQFESKKTSKLEEMYNKYKALTNKEDMERMARQIGRVAIESGDLKSWFQKFRNERLVMIELKKRKMK